ncbi:membrane protein insertase YidC [Comamonas serinivorans]|uniref:Membrane protein insertase YidC n=1 Tax=Comamonas serinivorans TaxID=1082851 RepID=A0A1Y0EI95_9BURK|nr:membrane protein insertase YidC [Comamonas serinivorans]ARU03316.1 membrane protein insertase YidC [Comamonas serinivorans]
MNDIRRSILWVIFGFSLILLWDQWQVHQGQPATFFPKPQPTASAPAAGGSAAGGTVPAASGTAAGAAGVPGAQQAQAAPAAPREKITVGTDVLQVTFDTQGGSVVHTAFSKYLTEGSKGSPVVLLDQSPQRFYVAQTGLTGAAPNHKTPMTFVGERQLADGAKTLVVRFESPVENGLKLVKTYTFERGSYIIGVRHEVFNQGGAPVTPELYQQLVRDGNAPEGESSFYSTFTGPVVYSQEAKYQKVSFKDLDKGKAEYQKSAPDGYVAMVQHYFFSAWLPAEGVQRKNYAQKVGDNLFSVGTLTPFAAIAPGASQAVDSRLVVSPQLEKALEQTAPGLELVKDYGMFTVIAKPLYWLLDWLHSFIGNWGWSIIALVVVIKIAFYWFNAKAYASMAKMKAVNPRITEMRERFKDKPQQLQQEMMKIYREEKINPLGGCLPILIQMPVFFALYWVLLSSVEMRGAPWVGWIHDLSVRDPYFILPLVMTVTTFMQTALNPVPPDPMQAKMMWFMPLIFSVMFYFFPAGLVLYWITNNVLTIAQQWLINTRMGVPPQFNLPKFK